MKQTMIWVSITLLITMVMACDNDASSPSDGGKERENISLTRSGQELVRRNNDFAFNLLRAIGEDKDQILSPISVTYALGMLNNGATGDTRKQITDVLGFSDADAVNDFCKQMLWHAPNLDNQTKVMISNTVFMNKGYELTTTFISKANDFYNAQPETRDFNDGKTLGVINQWASDHTDGMIKEVLTERTFNPFAVSYLLNAVYFKGEWTKKFSKDETQEEEFDHEGPEKHLLMVPMMHQEGRFLYYENYYSQILRLAYGNEAFCMTVLLPLEGKTVDDVLHSLSAASWRDINGHLSTKNLDIKIPHLETNSDFDLKTVLSKLGITDAFDENKAEFPDFCNKPTFINQMRQVARIKIDEEGTEAAAVTNTGIDALDYPPQTKNFHANHPFLYVISEQSTGTIFFIGKYMGHVR